MADLDFELGGAFLARKIEIESCPWDNNASLSAGIAPHAHCRAPLCQIQGSTLFTKGALTSLNKSSHLLQPNAKYKRSLPVPASLPFAMDFCLQ